MRDKTRWDSMNEQTALRALRLFNEKADKLDRLSFIDQVFEKPIGFRLRGDQDGFIVSRLGPSAESIDAFCLTMRFFIQDTEPSSFRRLSSVYAFLGEMEIVDQASVDEFESAREAIKDLSAPIAYIPPFEGKSYTPWEIFDTIFYGALSHANDEKARLYERWRARTEVLLVMENWFVKTLATLILSIDRVRPINKRAIESLMALPQSQSDND